MGFENLEVIGVDAGNGYIKTVTSEFQTALKKFDNISDAPMLKNGKLIYNGSAYIVGSYKRLLTKSDQKEDESWLVLTLAAIAKELAARNKTSADVILAEGLPIERCSEKNKAKEKKYYLEGNRIQFTYEDVDYDIFIKTVLVNPQGLGGALFELLDGGLESNSIIIDIGSGTTDAIKVIDGKPDIPSCQSLNYGINDCMNVVNAELRRSELTRGKDLPDNILRAIIRKEKVNLNPEIIEACESVINKYVTDLINAINECGFDTYLSTCYFYGGGSILIKNYGMDRCPMASLNEDIRFNAKGFEILGKQYRNSLIQNDAS